MRETRKRITVANDGFSNAKKSADERLDAKEKKYIEKKESDGWRLVERFRGDAFAVKEAIIVMSK